MEQLARVFRGLALPSRMEGHKSCAVVVTEDPNWVDWHREYHCRPRLLQAFIKDRTPPPLWQAVVAIRADLSETLSPAPGKSGGAENAGKNGQDTPPLSEEEMAALRESVTSALG